MVTAETMALRSGEEDQRLLGRPLEETVKVLTTVLLVALSLLLMSIFTLEIRDYAFYMHFLYLPIVISAFWWGKRGAVVSVVLAGALLLVSMGQQESASHLLSSTVEATLFVMVALLVGTLSDEKSAALKKEQRFKMETAHYFFNPLCIAEGNLDLAQQQASPDIRKELSEAQQAVERIKKVVINTVETGEIHE